MTQYTKHERFKWAEFLLFSIKTHLQGRSDWLPCQCINSFDNVLCEVLIFLELQPQAAFKLRILTPNSIGNIIAFLQTIAEYLSY